MSSNEPAYTIVILPPQGQSVYKARVLASASKTSARKQDPTRADIYFAQQINDHKVISPIFLSALYIREEAFIKGQNVNGEYELDDEDPISTHLVLFAKPTEQRSPIEPEAIKLSIPVSKMESLDIPPTDIPALKNVCKSTEIPASTVRIVPWHGHTHDAPPPGWGEPDYEHSTLWDGVEPFIKIGRVATLESCRARGYGSILMNEAVDFARNHAGEMVAMDERDKGESWKGLLLVHAQKTVVPWYRKLGFEVDAGMGEWVEEAILHQGLWKRVAIQQE